MSSPTVRLSPHAIKIARSEYFSREVTVIPPFKTADSGHGCRLNTLINFPELQHYFGHPPDYVVNFVFRIKAAQSEPESAVSHLVAYPKRFQYVTRLNARRRACRSGRQRDIIQAHYQSFALCMRKRHAQVAWQPVFQIAIDSDILQVSLQSHSQLLSQAQQIYGFCRHL